MSHNEARLRAAFEAVIDPILEINAKGIVLTANPAVQRVFGWGEQELIGRNVNVLMGEPYRSEHDGYLEHYLRTGERRAIGVVRKVVGRRRNGEDFPCEISISEVDDGAERSFVGIVRDKSEQEELYARVALSERLAAVGQLAAGVAHEINNPINTILNCAQLLLDGDEDPELLKGMQHEGERIAEIVRGLLDFARDKREEFELTDLREVVRQTTALSRRGLEKAGLYVEVQVDDCVPPVNGRFQQLEQVLLNLLLNARDALLGADLGGRRPTVRIILEAASPPATGVQLRVWDNGPGIAAEVLPRLFEPFFTTKRATGGTGLGLSVSHGIITGHGGEIDVRSEVGEFTEFIVRLPATH